MEITQTLNLGYLYILKAEYKSGISMIKIVPLIGIRDSGKTGTLLEFFGVEKRSGSYGYMDRVIKGKIVCAYGLCSPQELREYCNYNLVIENIKERLARAKIEVKKRRGKGEFIFIIPFGLYMRDGEINENCILKPIDRLKKDGYAVSPIYLRRQLSISSRAKDFDDFVKKVTTKKIDSIKDDEDRQAKELKKLIIHMF